MYMCDMCKNQFDGEVAFKNGAGSFCPQCKATIHSRAAEGMRLRIAALNGCCMWCGDKITDENKNRRSNDSEDNHVCYDCCRKRDWLLKCIRFSDKAYKYVVRTEERERPIREEREKMIDKTQKNIQEQSEPSEQEARLRRLELMLNKLTNALGV